MSGAEEHRAAGAGAPPPPGELRPAGEPGAAAGLREERRPDGERRPEVVSTRPLIDKLGVQPGARIAIVGVDDPDVLALIRDRTPDVTLGEPLPDTDIVFLAADTTAELDALPALRARIVPAGAIWVVSRKGKAATLRDVEVIAAARAHDLVDNKVVAFSATHTALRLVIPRALRPGDGIRR